MRFGARRISKKILEYDRYGAPINFNYSSGSTVFSTGLGACLSVFVILISFAYFANSMHVMYNRKDSKISAFIADQFFTYNDTITKDDGFQMAIGFDPRQGATNIFDYLELSVSIFRGDYSGETYI